MISAQKSHEIEPHPGLRLGTEPALDSLPHSLSAPPRSALSLQEREDYPTEDGEAENLVINPSPSG